MKRFTVIYSVVDYSKNEFYVGNINSIDFGAQEIADKLFTSIKDIKSLKYDIIYHLNSIYSSVLGNIWFKIIDIMFSENSYNTDMKEINKKKNSIKILYKADGFVENNELTLLPKAIESLKKEYNYKKLLKWRTYADYIDNEIKLLNLKLENDKNNYNKIIKDFNEKIYKKKEELENFDLKLSVDRNEYRKYAYDKKEAQEIWKMLQKLREEKSKLQEERKELIDSIKRIRSTGKIGSEIATQTTLNF